MKKLILLLSIITLFCQSSFAQSGGLNFQGVARNASGAVLANQKINLKFSILKTTETGTVEYTEIKEATTNAQGIFAVVVGDVNATSFASVDWKSTPKFLKVEMDAAGGTSFITMGTTRLQNVPFAYYANGVNANNIDGAVPVSKGGTGSTNVASARANLGLAIGTNVQAPLVAGKDYLTPTGTAIGLTNFPILNQNTTGNAATATKLAVAKKINGVDFDGTSDITIPTSASSNTLSGTISISNGGTGATNAADARANLGLVIGTNVQAPLTAGTDYLTPSSNAATTTKLATARNINGVPFDGSANITVAADASTISGTVSIAKGGTGATSAATALTNLGAESTANKSADITADASSLTKYPSVKVIKDYVDTRVITGVSSSTDLNITSVNGLQLGLGSERIESNVAIGRKTLTSNITGYGNVAIGDSSLNSNTNGDKNIALGTSAMKLNTDGTSNIAIGHFALSRNTTANGNIAFGSSSLKLNTTGSNNIALGATSLENNSTASNNIAIGTGSLLKNTLGEYNTSIGTLALSGNSTGTANVAIGYMSLNRNTVGSSNIAIGKWALFSNNGNRNIGIGDNALKSNTTGSDNTANGNNGLFFNTTGSYNTGIGSSTLYNNTTGNGNTAIGSRALTSNTEGYGNSSFGENSLNLNTTGNSNIAIGGASLNRNSTGNQNVAIGTNALFFNKSKRGSVAIGTNAMFNADDDANNPIWTGNTAVGWTAMQGSNTPANNTGKSNTALGSQSLGMYSSGSENVGAGSLSLYRNTSGSSNTGLGVYALGTNTTGSNNTAIGYQADVSTDNLSNTTALGNGAIVSSSNTIQLGNTEITDVKTSGVITAAGYKTPTGTSTQFLMADGSVNSNSANVNGFVHYVGELFGGGIVVSVWKEAGVEHGLIASMVDVASSLAVSNVINNSAAQSRTNGLNNTNAILAQTGNLNCAAKVCYDYVNSDYGTGVFSDWYLPSIQEVNVCYNASLIVNKIIGDINGFKFFEAQYFSSTAVDSYTYVNGIQQVAPNDAYYYVSFTQGSIYYTYGSNAPYTFVRAVRSF